VFDVAHNFIARVDVDYIKIYARHLRQQSQHKGQRIHYAAGTIDLPVSLHRHDGVRVCGGIPLLGKVPELAQETSRTPIRRCAKAGADTPPCASFSYPV
jgi:hypothetical protein